jgi:hypothetical protein
MQGAFARAHRGGHRDRDPNVIDHAGEGAVEVLACHADDH